MPTIVPLDSNSMYVAAFVAQVVALVLMLRTFSVTREAFLAPWIGFALCLALASLLFGLRPLLPAAILVFGAASLTVLAIAQIWLGARRLRGGATPVWVPLLAPVLWCALAAAALHRAPDGQIPAQALIALSHGLVLILLAGAIIDLGAVHRAERLRSVLDLMLVLALGALHALWRLWEAGQGTAAPLAPVAAAVILAFSVAISFLGLGIVGERAARREAVALQQSRVERTRLLAGLPAVIFHGELDARGVYRHLSLHGDLERVTGWPAAHIRKAGAWLAQVEPGALPFADLLHEVRTAGQASTEYRLRQPDGGWRWMRNVAMPLERRPDGTLEVVGYVLDVTAQREAEGRAVAAARLSALGEMAAGLAHELKQPLATISVAADAATIALDRGQLGAVRPRLAVIASQAVRAGALIEHLRRFARGADPDAPTEAVRVADAIAGALELVGGRLLDAEIALELELADPCPLVSGERIALEQVLVNLLLNARDALAALPSGRARRVRVVVEAMAAQVSITITDTAGGFPAAVLDRLFEPFVTTKGPDQGTGLGLWISRGLVMAMGGRLEAENGPEGARLRITLNAAEVAAPRD